MKSGCVENVEQLYTGTCWVRRGSFGTGTLGIKLNHNGNLVASEYEKAFPSSKNSHFQSEA